MLTRGSLPPQVALLETNPYLLALTIIVSIVHSVFEFLAFKNGRTVPQTREDGVCPSSSPSLPRLPPAWAVGPCQATAGRRGRGWACRWVRPGHTSRKQVGELQGQEQGSPGATPTALPSPLPLAQAP